MTTAPSEPPPRSRFGPAVAVERFDRVERIIHWTNAALFGVMIVTALCLYFGPLSTLVGRRALVRDVHVFTGLLLPVPILAGFAARRRGRAFRADVRRLNRFGPDDRRWLRSFGRDHSVRLGKFHPGQKLNAAFTAGAIVVMLASGAVMRWYEPFPLSWRTGATFVHDSLFMLLVVIITGHILRATRDADSLAGMIGGRVSVSWARSHHPLWLGEVYPTDPADSHAQR